MLFDRFYQKFSKDIGIDLGTANTLVYVKGKGIVINEPSVVAVNQRTKQILAIGQEARRMVGRTPPHIVATRPLVDGVISDFEVTEAMLRYFIDKVHNQTYAFLRRPRVVIGIPSGVTEVEKRAVVDAAINAGASQAFLIEEPMAAAIGSRLPVQDASGSMIVDIGGGTTEIAVISLGGVVVSKSLRIAGDEMNENIIQYARDNFNLLLGERTAEEVKIQIGSAYPLDEQLTAHMRGRDLVSGLPKEVIVTDSHIRDALMHSLRVIVNNIKAVIEEIPPELISDIMHRGIIAMLVD
jgi:rod shape-determining protein MreB